MTESEFATLSVDVIDRIEESLDACGIDVDLDRKGDGLLEIALENGSRIVINTQAPMKQIWVAAKSGGFHFASADGVAWLDTRSGEPLFDLLSRVVGEQAGTAVSLG
jgi:CyaY protein